MEIKGRVAVLSDDEVTEFERLLIDSADSEEIRVKIGEDFYTGFVRAVGINASPEQDGHGAAQFVVSVRVAETKEKFRFDASLWTVRILSDFKNQKFSLYNNTLYRAE